MSFAACGEANDTKLATTLSRSDWAYRRVAFPPSRTKSGPLRGPGFLSSLRSRLPYAAIVALPCHAPKRSGAQSFSLRLGQNPARFAALSFCPRSVPSFFADRFSALPDHARVGCAVRPGFPPTRGKFGGHSPPGFCPSLRSIRGGAPTLALLLFLFCPKFNHLIWHKTTIFEKLKKGGKFARRCDIIVSFVCVTVCRCAGVGPAGRN